MWLLQQLYIQPLEDLATVFSFLDIQEMGLEPNNTMYAKVEVLSL